MNQFARPGLGVTELPPVNADDNGKVLGVSDGAWAKVAASGGSDLPDDPAQDGTYNLQNTVSSGTSTLSWVSGSSGGGVLVVHCSEEGTLDKTWQQIHDALLTGGAVCVFPDQGVQAITAAGYPDIAGRYFVAVSMDQYDAGGEVFVTEDADGYPSGAE